MNLNQVTGPRRDILYYLKQHGPATVADLSSHLQMTGEAVRQHLLQLTQDKYIQRQSERAPAAGAGRPSLFYNLTVEGEHLFPKSYDGLTVELIDTIISERTWGRIFKTGPFQHDGKSGTTMGISAARIISS